jgi:hypothetical protein
MCICWFGSYLLIFNGETIMIRTRSALRNSLINRKFEAMSSNIIKAGYFSDLCANISSKLNKDGFDVKTKIYGDNIASMSVYSDDYGSGKVTLHYSSAIVSDDDVIFITDENTNESDEFYVNSENLIHDIVDWIEGGYFD